MVIFVKANSNQHILEQPQVNNYTCKKSLANTHAYTHTHLHTTSETRQTDRPLKQYYILLVFSFVRLFLRLFVTFVAIISIPPRAGKRKRQKREATHRRKKTGKQFRAQTRNKRKISTTIPHLFNYTQQVASSFLYTLSYELRLLLAACVQTKKENETENVILETKCNRLKLVTINYYLGR